MADEKIAILQGKNGKLATNVDKLLCVEDGDLSKVLKEANVSLKSCEENLEKIREWYDKQPHLPKGQINDRMLIRYLIFCNFSIEKVKEKLDNFYSAKNKMSDLLKNRDPRSPSVEEVLKTGYWVLFPKRTVDNHRISLFRIPETANKDLIFAEIMKISFMIGEYRVWNECSTGEHWVLDYTNMTFQFAMQCTPTLVSNITFILTHCFGAKLKGMHLIGLPQYCEALLSLFKKAMKPKVAERINIYNSYEELFKKLPKELFPSDYGGSQVSSKEIAESWMKTFQTPEWRQYFIDQDEACSDESKREGPTKLDEVFGVDGSFRKLDID